jgi:small subunit ribosomal protein S17
MKRSMRGRVVSARMEKTITVAVETKKPHPIYRKKFTQTQRFMAANEIGAREGDFVIIEESKPLSKNKRWNAVKVISEKQLEETS